MPEIATGSEVTKHSAHDFFVPDWTEVFIYILLSGVIIAVLNAGSIINKLSNNYIGAPDQIKASFSTFFDSISKTFSSALGGRLGQILVWASLGAVVYLLLWLARNLLNSFENDIISDRYLHPSNYNRAGYWGSSLSVKIFLAAEVLLTAGLIYLSLKVTLPSLAALAGSAVYHFHGAASLVYIAFAVLGVALLLYITVVLFKLMAHLCRFI